ncbi:histidine kinase [Paenibacillus darwinianus]|uniref:Histidine kinase n=1 Tax=Paenibacillus darwinianus TaxID=1380763 RepID=A0A9W5W7D7_9BACL|nr:sensor histidine kinase [Paenibacillus darwinianus]EXX89480.1 histidine kinase [Paenibacillus darwinianus]EXX91189.1 histidine kinase [Paenibacillus darwinianus]EXX92517.1 histidine kinase [Paenibacillus darwinianus]
MRFEWMRRSLRAKLIVFLILAIAVPMLLSIIVTNARTSDIVKKDALRQASNLMFQGKTNLIQYFNVTNQASLLPYNDSKFGDTLYKVLEQGKTDYLSEQEIYRTVQSIARSVKEIRQVYLHTQAAGKGYLVIKGNLYKAVQAEPYGGDRIPADRSVYIEQAHTSHPYGIFNTPYYASEEVITIHRKIMQIPENKQIGTIAIDIRTDVINSISSQLFGDDKEQLYLLSETGSVVYGPEGTARGERLGEEWVDEVLQLKEERGTRTLQTDDFDGWYVYEKLNTPYMNWTLVRLLPKSVVTASTRQVTAVNTIILSTFLLAAIAAAIYVSFRITHPIKRLIRYISHVQAGDLEVDIKLQGSDEIGIMAARFRKMMETINHLILREYKLQLANTSHQLKALQAQLQPHFLYNALQSIGTLALQHQAPKVYALIAQLAKMMRYSMNGSDEKVDISQEIEHVKAYLDLQQQRFGDKLTVDVAVEPGAASCKVPRMIVQPLVENVFKHGFDPAGGLIRLSVSAWMDGETVTVTVEDNGAGMSAQRLEEVRGMLRSNELEEKWPDEHIGLANVMTRLRLYCGPDARLELEPIESTEGGAGLRVTLRIPVADKEGMVG